MTAARGQAHGSLVKACIELIKARGGMAFKLQTGILPVAGRFVHAGRPGAPDVVGVMPEKYMSMLQWRDGGLVSAYSSGHQNGMTFGRFLAVECKTGTGRLSQVQQATHEELRKRGALVVTVRNIAELEAALTC